MRRKRHPPEEIIKKLREAAALLGSGKSVEEACRTLSVSPATYQRWKSEYGGMRTDALKRLKELEKENMLLKKAVADLTLDKAILKEFAEGKWEARPASGRRWRTCAPASEAASAGPVRALDNPAARNGIATTVLPHKPPLVAAMRRIAMREPRAGYRTVTRYLRREGGKVNLKRVHRFWKMEGLKVPPRVRKRRRLGSTANSAQRRQAHRINQVWSYDFVHDRTERGTRLKWLPGFDEYTRECLSLEVESSMTAKDVIQTLQRLVEERGAPEFIRSDNGRDFIAAAVKDWIASKGMTTLYIEPGSPWENPYSESCNSRFRDEFLNVEAFGSKREAKMRGSEHRVKYNHHRPHSSLGDLTPAEFAERCLAPLRPFDFVEKASGPQDSVTNPKQQPNLS